MYARTARSLQIRTLRARNNNTKLTKSKHMCMREQPWGSQSNNRIYLNTNINFYINNFNSSYNNGKRLF